MRRITVLLVEDHMVVREGFRKMLELEDDLEVVGEAQDGRQAVAMVKKLLPNVVVMDIAMPLLNGLEATRQILKAVPGTRILILSAHSDDAYINGATDSGAMGFLLKQASAHVLAEGIREVQKGNTFFSPTIAKRLHQLDGKSPDRAGMPRPRNTRLSSREKEVLQLIAEGKTNKETAAELGIRIKTVEKHREHLMRKLGLHDTASLTRYAISVDGKSPDQAGMPQPRNARLSSREMEVLQLIAEGKTNKENAAELGIGMKTVEKHREHLMQKLGLHDTAGLTSYAISAGIIESNVQLTITPC